jgi:hypothetical protein
MEKHDVTVPYIAYESMLDKEDRQQKRMVIIIVVLVVLLLTTNLMWLIAWNQYDYVDLYDEVDVDTDGGGNANYIGEKGDIYNGINSSNSQTENEDAL